MRLQVSSKLLNSLFHLAMLPHDLTEEERGAHVKAVQDSSKVAVNRSMAIHSGPDDYFWNVVRMIMGGEIPQLEAKSLKRTTFASLETQVERLIKVTPYFPMSDPMDFVEELFVKKNRDVLVEWILAGDEKNKYRGWLAELACQRYRGTPELRRVRKENPWPKDE